MYRVCVGILLRAAFSNECSQSLLSYRMNEWMRVCVRSSIAISAFIYHCYFRCYRSMHEMQPVRAELRAHITCEEGAESVVG